MALKCDALRRVGAPRCYSRGDANATPMQPPLAPINGGMSMGYLPLNLLLADGGTSDLECAHRAVAAVANGTDRGLERQ